MRELGGDAAVDNVEHLLPVLDVDGEGHALDDLHGVLQATGVALADDSGVQVLGQQGLRNVQQLAGCTHGRIHGMRVRYRMHGGGGKHDIITHAYPG